MDKLLNVRITRLFQLRRGARPADFPAMQHCDIVCDGAYRCHIMGDRDRRRAHIRDDFTDQIVDYT